MHSIFFKKLRDLHKYGVWMCLDTKDAKPSTLKIRKKLKRIRLNTVQSGGRNISLCSLIGAHILDFTLYAAKMACLKRNLEGKVLSYWLSDVEKWSHFWEIWLKEGFVDILISFHLLASEPFK